VGHRQGTLNPRAQPIPDLYVREVLPEARRLYELAIAHSLGNPTEVLRVARAVRRHATKHADAYLIAAMLRWETDALVGRGEHAAAWRTWLRRQKGLPRDTTWSARSTEAGLLYFNGRLEEARSCFESALQDWMERSRWSSFLLLFRIFNTDDPPTDVLRVCLHHIYQALGRSLDEWTGWPRFVRSLSRPLLRAVGVDRAQLLAHPRLLARMVRRIDRIRSRRIWTGVSRGEADVTGSPAQVERWQRSFARLRGQVRGA